MLVSLRDEGLSERLAEFSDSKRITVLVDGDLTIWDSLAICEHLSEVHLGGKGWPSDVASRARAITAEVHAGFTALRNELPMNCRASRKVTLSAAANADVRRVDQIWSRYAQQDDVGDFAFVCEIFNR